MNLTRIIFTITILYIMVPVSYAQQCNENLTRSNPDSNYTDHGDGTVTDNSTELMWQKCPVGLSGGGCSIGSVTKLKWNKAAPSEALLVNVDKSLGGYTNWRLPNLKELFSLVETACTAPTLNTKYFPVSKLENSISGLIFWSSTPVMAHKNSHERYGVNFHIGKYETFNASGGVFGETLFLVRYVRTVTGE